MTRVFTLRVQRRGEPAVAFILERPWIRGEEKTDTVTYILVGR